ncbi:substrate-binding domain-containing protein [Noviherbaspirillum saxi]|uniref:PBP domain-containing protein n=1 Tax=Noviherbaspirillum saxi TaxID=2320863 RepID=A0A3A3FGV0_9BURK|nr:substrate-binding domain-containing protein [Noviherbaspirillum saxi]RJF91724.1 hypothetical protein D3871_23820 [Noviherbaspirillum saxi]
MNKNKPLILYRHILLCILLAASSTAIASATRIVAAGSEYLNIVFSRLGNADLSVVLEYTNAQTDNALSAVEKGHADFAVIDTAMTRQSLEEKKLLQFPIMSTAVVPIFNLSNLQTNALTLNAPVLADIMAGNITSWSSPAIRKLNPQVELPALPITRVIRKENSGTTAAMSAYLSNGSESFRKNHGVFHDARWDGAAIQVPDAVAVARKVSATPGAISYIELDIGNQSGARFIQLRQPGGSTVTADYGYLRAAGFSMRGEYTTERDNSLLVMNHEESWPIMVPIYVVIRDGDANADKVKAIQQFFLNCFKNDWVIEQYGFVPLPSSLQARAVSLIHRMNKRSPKAQPINR